MRKYPKQIERMRMIVDTLYRTHAAFVLILALAHTEASAATIASLKADVRSGDAKRLAGWSFQWNPTGVAIGKAADYEDLAPGSGAHFRSADYSKGTDNDTNATGKEQRNNRTVVYNRVSDGGWWLISGALAEHSTDGLDHYLVLGYTIQEGEAGDLRLRTFGGNSAPSKLRFYVNDKLVAQNDFTHKLNKELTVDLGVLDVGDTIYVAFAADSGVGANHRRWYGDIQVAHRATMTSHDTGYTIQKVRTAKRSSETLIIGSAYDGAILGLTYTGTVRWTTPLSGYMVHDLWCADITGNGKDEILAANADGAVYCLDTEGRQQWRFRPNEGGHLPPMYAVCAIRDKDGTPYVVCGGFDKNVYYLSASGTLVKVLESSTYSVDQPWGAERVHGKGHIANFLRPIPQPSSYDRLAVLGIMNHMQSAGTIYLFEPLADTPLSTHEVSKTRTSGDFRVWDPEGDGAPIFVVGSSALADQYMVLIDPSDGSTKNHALKGIGPNGYRVTQVETIPNGEGWQYFMLCGTHIVLIDADLDPGSQRRFGCKYAFNDMWKDAENNKILLASAQSGGSCIHIIDLDDPQWPEAFMDLEPPGKIQTILDNAAKTRSQLANFTAPAWERKPVPVYEAGGGGSHPVAAKIIAGNYGSPVFLNTVGGAVENTDWRDDPNTGLSNERYRKKIDQRMKHIETQEQILKRFTPEFEGVPGISYWAGHGNDPYYFQPTTHMKILDAAKGRKTVMIWPEMNGASEDFSFVMNHLIYPVAAHASTRNGNIHIRNKGTFWSGAVYLPAWSRLVSGEFANVFVTSMEETTDKTQDLSIAGRLGMWASGALDDWGMRCSRDNPSFDRSRQHSYQRLPNHFLRTMVYCLANGATHMQNTYVDADHMSLAWELVAKGALYVPKREEIVSFSPVFLSMIKPDEHYLEEAENHKFSIFYNREFEENNPFVFSRMNASWMAAPVTQWDFSRYASGVKDRRQNFIPPFPNGTVLITPPQSGEYADPSAPRGKLTDHLHPMYKNIMTECVTDGRFYYSQDGTKKIAADQGHRLVEAAIKNKVSLLPLTVSGDVAWSCAQTSQTHLRLTLVDSGYLNPQDRTARVQFHAVTPTKMVDLLDGKTYDASDPTAVSVDVPLGLFRFIDIELDRPFFPSGD